jgi:NitT/TauT family transport system ATP-binding protein
MQPDASSSTGSNLVVDLRGIRRTFPGPVHAIDGVDLQVAEGEFIAILGPSGCGKSTLLRVIAGLDKPDAGTMHVAATGDDENRIAYVFQDAHLLPWRNLLDNVALPLELMGKPKAEREAAAHSAVKLVGLADALTRYPAELSGGMRMRASLARALVVKPKLLLLDEPFAALDEISRQQLDEQLHQLWREQQITVIFVTHSIIEAAFLAQRAVVMSRRPARVVLDHVLDLPPQRDAALRTTVSFAREMQTLNSCTRAAANRTDAGSHRGGRSGGARRVGTIVPGAGTIKRIDVAGQRA